MSLKDTLAQDIKSALKEKDVIRKEIIQIVRANILQKEKDEKIQLNDDDIISIITKEVSKINDVIPFYEQENRKEDLIILNKKIEILNKYLPKQLTEDELVQLINETIEETNAKSIKDIGVVMKSVSIKTKNKCNPKVVSEKVKYILSKI